MSVPVRGINDTEYARMSDQDKKRYNIDNNLPAAVISPAATKTELNPAPFTYPEFTYPEFTYPEFNKEDIGFTTRKQSPLDFTGLMKQGRQRQAITGVPTSESFYKGIAEPMLKTKAKENVALTELENKRRLDTEKQAFNEYAFGKTSAFKTYAFGKESTFKTYESGKATKEMEWKADWESNIKERELEIAKIQAENSGGGGGDSIICTELHRRGLLPENVLKADGEYRRKYIDDEAYYGYLFLAEPIVSLMKKSFIFTLFIKLFAGPFAHEAASRINHTIKGNIMGRIILKTGKPICKYYYRLRTRFTHVGGDLNVS